MSERICTGGRNAGSAGSTVLSNCDSEKRDGGVGKGKGWISRGVFEEGDKTGMVYKQGEWAISELSFTSVSKRVLVRSLSYGN